MKLIAEHLIEGQFPVRWSQTSENRQVVVYGAERSEFSDTLRAAEEFGRCIHHQAECEGRLEWLSSARA